MAASGLAAWLAWQLGTLAGRLVGALRAPLMPVKPARPFDAWREVAVLILWFVGGAVAVPVLFAVLVLTALVLDPASTLRD